MSFCAITKLTDLINIMKKIRIKYGMKNTHLLLFFFCYLVHKLLSLDVLLQIVADIKNLYDVYEIARDKFIKIKIKS